MASAPFGASCAARRRSAPHYAFDRRDDSADGGVREDAVLNPAAGVTKHKIDVAHGNVSTMPQVPHLKPIGRALSAWEKSSSTGEKRKNDRKRGGQKNPSVATCTND